MDNRRNNMCDNPFCAIAFESDTDGAHAENNDIGFEEYVADLTKRVWVESAKEY